MNKGYKTSCLFEKTYSGYLAGIWVLVSRRGYTLKTSAVYVGSIAIAPFLMFLLTDYISGQTFSRSDHWRYLQ